MKMFVMTAIWDSTWDLSLTCIVQLDDLKNHVTHTRVTQHCSRVYCNAYIMVCILHKVHPFIAKMRAADRDRLEAFLRRTLTPPDRSTHAVWSLSRGWCTGHLFRLPGTQTCSIPSTPEAGERLNIHPHKVSSWFRTIYNRELFLFTTLRFP